MKRESSAATNLQFFSIDNRTTQREVLHNLKLYALRFVCFYITKMDLSCFMFVGLYKWKTNKLLNHIMYR
jgi:hypothetical protein